MTRLLLERVTKFVCDRSTAEHGEARKLRIEYSTRGGLRYSQMAAYYEWMKLKKHNPFLPWGRIYIGKSCTPTCLGFIPTWTEKGFSLQT